MIALYIIGYLLIGFFTTGILYELTNLYENNDVGMLLFTWAFWPMILGCLLGGWIAEFVYVNVAKLGAKLGMVVIDKAGPAISWCARSPVFAFRRLKVWRSGKKLPVARIVKKTNP